MKQTSQRTKQKYNDACISYAVQGRAKTKGKLWVFAAILTLCGLVVDRMGESIFTPSATGRCRYQLPGSADWNTQMLEKIRRYNKMM